MYLVVTDNDYIMIITRYCRARNLSYLLQAVPTPAMLISLQQTCILGQIQSKIDLRKVL